MKRKLLVIFALVASLGTTGMTVYAAPKTMPDGTVFDAEYYAETYPDVKNAIGNDETALYNHYVQHGKAEGRKATADTTSVQATIGAEAKEAFDPVFYANTYPDVKAAYGTDETALYNHYITCGKAEGRLGTAGQSVKKASVSNNVVTDSAKSTASNTASVTVPQKEETTGNLVWVPVNGGTKYHNNSSCSKMENPMQVSIETAKANGYTACKKCYK